MAQEIKVAGVSVTLAWTKSTERAFYFRLSEIGFTLNSAAFKGAKLASSFCKCLWALLPADQFRKYESPEDLFVAIDHEAEGAAIYAAISEIFAEMTPTDEKKSTLTISPSPASS